MASGRMLQRKISQSHDVAMLIETVSSELGLEHGAFAALLFTWAIAHQDREGRMHGDPRLVKAAVFPLIDSISAKHVDAYLGAMQRLGLVNWYEVDGKRYLQFPTFDVNQPGIRKEREPESIIPEPTSGLAVTADKLPSNCRQTADNVPAQEKGKERKGIEREGKGRAANAAAVSVLGMLNEARKRAIPGARAIGANPSSLEHIEARLKDGYTVEDCAHVIAVCAAEVQQSPATAKWFNTVSPFRKDNFARKLGGNPSSASASGHARYFGDIEAEGDMTHELGSWQLPAGHEAAGDGDGTGGRRNPEGAPPSRAA